MLHSSRGKVFLYNENKDIFNVFDDFFTDRSLQMFGSDNLYYMIKYAREINPDIMIFNIHDKPERTFSPVGHFEENIKTQYPIIVTRTDDAPFKIHPCVAHYLRMPRDNQKFGEITESYSLGGKKHKVMLMGSYNEQTTPLKRQFENENISYFEVHNEIAAEIYLSKNTPQIVCVENTEPYKTARIRLRHNRVFYVDRQQDITEIKKFLP